MSFKFIKKGNRGGRNEGSEGSFMRIAKVKDGVNFTMYQKFIELTGATRFTKYAVGVDAKKIAFMSDQNGYSVTRNGKSDSSLRVSVPSKEFSFVSNRPVYIKKKHISIENGMVIINYGLAFFDGGK